MRMRKKKHGAERIAACSHLLIEDVSVLKDGFDGIFPENRPVHMEIGCGKGNFASGMAAKNPDVNFVAVERVADVCCIALEKANSRSEKRPGDNLRFIIGDAKELAENVKPHSLDCIYLNFSDPWPKARHAKRRLTYGDTLLKYRQVLKPEGFIAFKTDNEGLFDFTMEEIERLGFEIKEMSRDLHNSDLAAKEFTTEYEEKFRGFGKNINYVKI